MRAVLIFLLALHLQAKILEVKQLFNIQTVSVKKISHENKKSFYANTKIDEFNIKAVSLRYDGYINRFYIDKKYQYIKKSQALFNIFSKEAWSVHQELLIAKNISRSAKKDAIEKLHLLGLDQLVKKRKTIYNFDVKSPYSGYVLEKSILEGGFVKKGTTILKIVDLSKLWVFAKVYPQDITFIKLGMKTKIEIEGFETAFGFVDFIYPEVDVKDQSITVRISLENPKLKYYPDLFAMVTFLDKPKEILSLPKSAVLKKDNKYYVFIPIGENGQFEPKEIKAKRISSKYYQILSGLNESDKVVKHSLFMLDSDAVTNDLYESEVDDDW